MRDRFLYQIVYIILIMYLLFESKILIVVEFRGNNNKKVLSNNLFSQKMSLDVLKMFLNMGWKTSLVFL